MKVIIGWMIVTLVCDNSLQLGIHGVYVSSSIAKEKHKELFHNLQILEFKGFDSTPKITSKTRKSA
jgi:hypothetical protein